MFLPEIDFSNNKLEGGLEPLLGSKSCTNSGDDRTIDSCELTGNAYSPAVTASCNNLIGADVGDASSQVRFYSI